MKGALVVLAALLVSTLSFELALADSTQGGNCVDADYEETTCNGEPVAARCWDWSNRDPSCLTGEAEETTDYGGFCSYTSCATGSYKLDTDCRTCVACEAGTEGCGGIVVDNSTTIVESEDSSCFGLSDSNCVMACVAISLGLLVFLFALTGLAMYMCCRKGNHDEFLDYLKHREREQYGRRRRRRRKRGGGGGGGGRRRRHRNKAKRAVGHVTPSGYHVSDRDWQRIRAEVAHNRVEVKMQNAAGEGLSEDNFLEYIGSGGKFGRV